jgi:hypothetical protein
MGSSLLMGGQVMLDFTAVLVQLIINVEDGSAREPEYSVDPLFFQTLYNYLCAC